MVDGAITRVNDKYDKLREQLNKKLDEELAALKVRVNADEF